MKRFVVMSTLLVILLLVARAVGAAELRLSAEAAADAAIVGPSTERESFFGHTFRAPAERTVRRVVPRRAIDAPRRVEDRVRLRMRDRDYRRVWVETDLDDWTRRALEYDPVDERWWIELDLSPGRVRYVFVVEDHDGDVRTRTDVANPTRRRDAERGWVSEMRIDRDGDVVLEPRRPRRSRGSGDDYDLVVFDDAVLAYQRVDGALLGLVPRLRSGQPWSPSVEGMFLYGFSSERWSSRLSLVQPLAPGGRVRAHVAVYDMSDTMNRTGVGAVENSLSTLMFREDNLDWFRREGLTWGLEADVPERLLARVEIRSDTYGSLDRRVIAGWWGREDFLPNPAVDEGLMRSVFARLRVGTDLDHLWLEFETSDDDLLPSEFDFTRLTAQYRGRLRLGRDGHLDLRLRYGTALSGELPRQRRYLAGGIGTVRGYRYQSLLFGADPDAVYGGEQQLLANAELVLDEDDFGFAFFADAGQVWVDRDDPIDLSDMVSSIGVGLLLDQDDDDGGLRADLIRPLERDGDLMVQLRLRRPF
mgnify:CR=1 FL=1